ncbi:MAG: hypothetical protein QXY49_02020 [Thermofilaceae archaeon]
MILELHTPGHSAYSDTLMMYALAGAASAHLRKVVGRGAFYTLIMDGLTVEELAEKISGVFNRNMERISNSLTRLLDEKDVNKASDAFADEKRLAEYLIELTSTGHSGREGRFGKGSTFALPLMPTAGKYLRTDLTEHKKYAPKSYEVCSYCSALAILGLALGSLNVRQRSTNVVTTVKFDGEIEGDTLGQLIDYFTQLSGGEEKLFKVAGQCLNKMPERLFGYLVLAGMNDRLIVQMENTNARWTALISRFEVVRVVQVRGYYSVELDTVLASLAGLIRIEEEFKVRARGKLADTCETLLRICSVQSLEKLFDFLSTRKPNEIYGFVRAAFSDLKQEHMNLSASELVEALARLCIGM